MTAPSRNTLQPGDVTDDFFPENPRSGVRVKAITVESSLYEQALKVRQRAMFLPFEHDIAERDLSCDSAPHSKLIVALTEDNRVVGTALMMPVKEDAGSQSNGAAPEKIAHWLCARFVCVDPVFQGRHIGDVLMSAIEHWARHQGFHGVTLRARENAIAFYRRCGYRGEGPVFMPDDAFLPHWWMHKELTDEQ
ncbi:MAG: GNAT family N-acetyltransferase [Actinomycetaceae bacterium]|nr:GNAT family N-acetyltransferase [Actinomycetaceae bacterium]